MKRDYAGTTITVMLDHHPECPHPWEPCECAALWAADYAEEDPDALDCAYGQFYDPDWESDPLAPCESYGGWRRAYYPGVGL